MTAWGNGVFIHPGTIKQGYLTKSPPLEKTKNIVAVRGRHKIVAQVHFLEPLFSIQKKYGDFAFRHLQCLIEDLNCTLYIIYQCVAHKLLPIRENYSCCSRHVEVLQYKRTYGVLTLNSS